MTAVTVNLVPEFRIVRRQRRQCTARWAGVLGVGALVSASVTLYGRLSIDEDIGRLEAQLEKLVVDARTFAASIPALEQQSIEIERASQVGEFLAARPDWGLLLAMLDAERGEHIGLRRVEVKPMVEEGQAIGVDHAGPVELALRGVAASQAEAQAYALRLEALAVFTEVRPIATQRLGDGQQERIGFRLTCVIGGEA